MTIVNSVAAATAARISLEDDYDHAVDPQSDEAPTLTVSSQNWWLIDPKLTVAFATARTDQIEAGGTEITLSRQEWDKTLGPVFDRTLAYIHNPDRSDIGEIDIAKGYIAMSGNDYHALHNLMQTADSRIGPDAVNVTPAQVRALATIEREAAAYAADPDAKEKWRMTDDARTNMKRFHEDLIKGSDGAMQFSKGLVAHMRF